MQLGFAARFPRCLSVFTFHGALSDLCIPDGEAWVWGCPQAEILNRVH